MARLIGKKQQKYKQLAVSQVYIPTVYTNRIFHVNTFVQLLRVIGGAGGLPRLLGGSFTCVLDT